MGGFQGEPRRVFYATDMIRPALWILLFWFLIRSYYPFPSADLRSDRHENKIFTCHAPQANLLNQFKVSRRALEEDAKWASDLLEVIVRGDSDHGNATDSISLSIFLPIGDPIFEAGFGKVKANESESHAPNRHSIYRMASVTKLFTTAQLLLQKQRGQLNLDQDVANILHDFEPSRIGWTGQEQDRIITTRQLLSHTSGLLRDAPIEVSWPHFRDPYDNETNTPEQRSRSFIMDLIRKTPAVVDSWSTPVYSNVAFDVAGWIAAEIEKRSYEELLIHDIFKPLNMESASFFVTPDKLNRIVVPSQPNSIWTDWDLGDENPSGGLYCSADDLRKFGQEVLRAGSMSGTPNQIIFNQSTTREWLRPIHNFDDGLMSLGLAWEIFTVPAGTRRLSLYTKGGTLPGFHTLFGIDPEREFGFALLMSGEPKGIGELGIQIMSRFAMTLDKQRESILAGTYAGTYVLDVNNVLQIDVVDGGLGLTAATLDGEDIFKTLHLGEDEGNWVALWPTGELGVWRLAIGRPPAQSYGGCLYKFASIDPAWSKGFPIDLLMIKDGKLTYGAMNSTFMRQPSKLGSARSSWGL